MLFVTRMLGYFGWEATIANAFAGGVVTFQLKSTSDGPAVLSSVPTYDRLAESIGATCVAFAVESSGGFGAEALKFAKELIALGAKVKNVWAPHEVVHGIYRSIAIAVANGNADILEANLRSCSAWD